MANLRQLTAKEVEFSIHIESEHISVRGNCMASDDPAFDKECEDAIIARLDQGDTEAWCVIVVKATWKDFEGSDSLGGCSLDGDYTAETAVDEHGLRANALAALNDAIKEAFERISPLLEGCQ